MNKDTFISFYLKVVLPNNPSYGNNFNQRNENTSFAKLIESFISTYSKNPFDINTSEEVKELISQKKEPFASYSQATGTNVPHAILNKHYSLFLEYNKTLQYTNLQELVQDLHKLFGHSFINKFQEERVILNGNTRKASSTEIFGIVRDDYWTINKGSERELQYHIYKDGDIIGYGLGFNAQKSQNNLNPIENVSPFINSFFLNKQKIDSVLVDYSFINHSIQELKNIEEGDFILFGKKNKIKLLPTGFEIHGLLLLELYYDMKYRQFEVYKLIFQNSKKIPLNVSNIFKTMENRTVLEYKKQIILQGPPGTGKTREAKLIAKEILGLDSIDDLKGNEQFKLIQFHPSYTYEDFVRGIVVTTNEGVPEYKTLNKILGDFAKKANQSNLTGGVDDFERAWNQLLEDINENKVKKIGTSNVNVEINSQGNIKFASPVATFEKTYELYKFGKTDLKYETYQKIVLNYLKNPEGPYKLKDYVAPQEMQSNTPYVLVIDEINRANLSSVLGELIYALEYRGQTVESIYSTVEDGHSLVLPNNLYIIGTMNTADRSVGHIDYAIRRRFAFVEVLPKNLTLTAEMNDGEFYTDLFLQVKALFTTDEYVTKSAYISPNFDPKDVALGHSYFIDKIEDGGDKKTRWKYEIKPILLEYIRDGILTESALEKITEIEASL